TASGCCRRSTSRSRSWRMPSTSSRTASTWRSPARAHEGTMVRTTGPLPEVVGALRRFRAGTSEAAGRHPFASRTRFSPETWYGNETIYTTGTQYTNARTKHHGRGTEPLFGTGLRSDVRLRGDRLRAQADGPAQPPFRAQAVQRTAGGDRDLPELPREDAEGGRGGRDRGAEGPPGSARGGRVPPVAERAGPVRGDPRPGGLGDAVGHGGQRGRPEPCGSAAGRDAARQRARL